MVIINELEKDLCIKDKTIFQNTTPTAFIERYCSKLNINKELTQVCKFAAKQIEIKKLIPENTPQSVAAGIIYFVSLSCNINISKRDVWQKTDTSELHRQVLCKTRQI